MQIFSGPAAILLKKRKIAKITIFENRPASNTGWRGGILIIHDFCSFKERFQRRLRTRFKLMGMQMRKPSKKG